MKNYIKKELTNFVVNNSSLYPKIKGCYSGKTRLEDIFKNDYCNIEENSYSIKKIIIYYLKN